MPGMCFIGSTYHKGHDEKTEVDKVSVCKRQMLNPGEILLILKEARSIWWLGESKNKASAMS